MDSKKVVKLNFLIFIMIFSVISPVLMVQEKTSLLVEKNNPRLTNQAGSVDFDWWELEHSTSDVASEIATVVGSDDSVHVAYFDDVNDNIKYAYFDGASWTNETVWTHGEIGSKSLIADLDIALDSNNFPFISFRDNPGADYLYISERQNGYWQNYTGSIGQPMGGTENRIIIDSNDDLHVIHDEGANIGYEFSSLTNNTVSPCSSSPGIAPGVGISFTVKSDGLPMIGFVENMGNGNILKLAECTSNSQWIIQNILTLNGGISGLSMALDESDNPTFSYLDTAINSELIYAEMNISSNTWQTTSLDNGGGSGLGGIGSTSLLIDEDSDKYVIYYAGNRVNIAQQIDGIWQTPYFIDAPTDGDAGRHISADIDSFGMPRISYQANLANRSGFGLHHIRIIPSLNEPGHQEGSIFTNTTLSAGEQHTCAILDNSEAKCWGHDGDGQLGDGGINTDINVPSSTAIDLGMGRAATAVSTRIFHTCAILDNGDLKCWGWDLYGQLGDGGSNTDTNAPSSTAIDLGTGRTAVVVSAGGYHTCVILDNGDMKCWGRDVYGQLGDGGSNTNTNAPSSTAIDLGSGRTAVAISAGWEHTCAILDNGDLKCWGYNNHGQLGDGGSNTDINVPSSTAIDLGSGRTAVAVAAGFRHTCVILDNGDLKCWGWDGNGQLGDGGINTDTNAPSSTAIDLGTGRTAVAVSVGAYHTCTILDNGDMKCWGRDNEGQLGDGGSNMDTNAPSSTAIDLSLGRTAVAVSAGHSHTCAILDNGDVKCWGHDSDGQLGDGGSNTDTNAPSSTAINLGAGRTAALSERDVDGDGILNIFDNTPYFPIPDTDSDGWTDDVDAFPNDSTQWFDGDGDGYGDNLTGNNPDAFPSESSQWNDTDGDGYGDNQSGFEPDDCVSVWGNSTNGRFGCPDDDGDGLANIDDAFPDDPLRGGDADLDGYDDALDDECPLIWGNSTIDRIGCIDTDGDGYSDGDLNWTVVNGSDAFPSEISQWLDSDGDGYGDNSTGFEADQCPQVWGNSTIGQLGCPDNDGDGLSNTEDDCPDSNNSIGSTDSDGDGCLDAEDAFPDDSTEHEDSDGDGIGDNSDPEPGVPLDSDGDGYPDRPGYADSDDCPQILGNSTGELVGCLDTDGDGLADTVDAFPNDGTRTTDTDLDGYDDLIEDDCVDELGNSTIDLLGCLDSDGDGVSDINDLFPDDSTDWNDDDGDGVGNNSDVFPQDANETIDSDGDGVGDNADLFPQDANETVDSDGDGIGDNEDHYPLQDNFIDTDNDGIFDVEDVFPTDPTQWKDADNDGFGDNLTGLLPDLFPSDESQWADLDGDGYGDNWGNTTWNQTRLFIWPGMYIENASNTDHCPDLAGNSSADGYFGCPDLDGDTIADMYDDEIDIGGENNETQQTGDLDNDGVSDLYDFCPNSQPEDIVDSEGCLIDQDNDGVGDNLDQCPNTKSDVEVNIEGCEIITEEPDNFFEEILAGDSETIAKTVGFGAILIAVIGFMQTNFLAAMLPDAFRWVQVFRKKSKLSAEEEMELSHLQSVVQTYFNDAEELKEELFNLKSDLTARFTNGEIKEETRKLIFTLIGDLLTMESAELKRIAHDDRFFGLAGTTDTKERLEMLEIEKAMRSFDDDSNDEEVDSFGSDFLDKNSPSPKTKGIINEDDGHEYIEHPADSGRWFIRNTRTKMWDEWKD